MTDHAIELQVNGQRVTGAVEPRLVLSDFLRHNLGLTGTHVGCEHGVCGACTVIVDGDAIRACLMFAVQANGSHIETVESLVGADGGLHPVQRAMQDEYGLQCGFCTPGILMTMAALVADGSDPGEQEMVEAVSGHLCRCTGYQGIRRAALRLVRERRAGDGA